MVALRSVIIQEQPRRTTGNHQRRASLLIQSMNGQYRQFARRERVLLNIGQIIRNDVRLLPVQCQEAVKHLLALRQAAQAAHAFYSQLDPQAMKMIKPWGSLTKLAYLDEQVTELILLLDALTPISTQSSYDRVKIQLLTRHQYPLMFLTYDETVHQLAALIDKARQQTEEEAQ